MIQSALLALQTADGIQLHLRRWPAPEPARGTVQIVHGLGEHLGRYEALAVSLNAAGWHVAGHDHRGHGRSEGPRGRIASHTVLLTDLAAVVDRLRGPGRHLLWGHSLGGLVAARFVAEPLMKRPALGPARSMGSHFRRPRSTSGSRRRKSCCWRCWAAWRPTCPWATV